MSTATLQDIITKVRKLTGSGTSQQLADNTIIDYINSFYLYDFPSQLRSLQLKDTFTINTIKNIDTYSFDFVHYETLEAPAYVDKRLVPFYTSPWPFWGQFFNWQYRETLATGNGTQGLETATITGITNAAQAVVTSAAHTLQVGNRVVILNVGGMTQLNGNTYTITAITVNTFTLNVDSTGFGVYTAGGEAQTSAYNGTVTSAPIIRSTNNNPITSTNPSPSNNPQQSATLATGSYPPAFNEPYPSRMQNILISANVQVGTFNQIGTLNATDDGNGNIIGDATGFINYDTGEVTALNFTQDIPSGTAIEIHYNPALANIPQGILFWKNNIILRPVPDKGYTVEINVYRRPSQILLGSVDPNNPTSSGVPELLEWWETLAAGAAKKVFEDRQDMDGVAMMDKMLEERYALNETRTYASLGSQRVATIFSGQLNGYGSTPFWGYGGQNG